MNTYDQHLAWLIREESYFRAERYGFQLARDVSFVKAPYGYSSNPREQARYEQGFNDGRAMMIQEQLQGGAHVDVETQP